MTNRPDRVCLDLKMEVLLPKDSLEHLEYIFGKDVRNMYGDALVILSTAEIEGVVSNLRLQGLLNKHSSGDIYYVKRFMFARIFKSRE